MKITGRWPFSLPPHLAKTKPIASGVTNPTRKKKRTQTGTTLLQQNEANRRFLDPALPFQNEANRFRRNAGHAKASPFEFKIARQTQRQTDFLPESGKIP
jgi:hypothetical protein